MKNPTVAHQPVMLHEVLEGLAIIPDGIYVDGTFGRGGHSREILAQLNENGRLLCLDKDPEAIAYGQAHFGDDPRVSFHQICFSQLPKLAYTLGLTQKINGILLDLGVSSPQLDEAERGFSFMRDGPLDMRMDNTKGQSAQEWLQTADKKDIFVVLRRYGEEPFASKIAAKICEVRVETPIVSTVALAKLVADCIPMKFKKTPRHPATKTFQAIRLHINQELTALDTLLAASQNLLAAKGRLAMISFHSLEDRRVKQYFSAHSKVTLPRGVAIPESELVAPLQWINKRQNASESETDENPRARSATLRVAEKR
jgi:16S rRNA (cytosine1402-N4)-methyltransferase